MLEQITEEFENVLDILLRGEKAPNITTSNDNDHQMVTPPSDPNISTQLLQSESPPYARHSPIVLAHKEAMKQKKKEASQAKKKRRKDRNKHSNTTYGTTPPNPVHRSGNFTTLPSSGSMSMFSELSNSDTTMTHWSHERVYKEHLKK